MVSVCTTGRINLLRIVYPLSSGRKPTAAFISSKKNDSDSSDDEKETKNTPSSSRSEKSRAALEKLNLLIQSMVKEEKSFEKSKHIEDRQIEDRFAKPRKYFVKKGIEAAQQAIRKSSEEKSTVSPVEKAVREAAEALGGDTKKTESELLSKLLSHSTEVKQGPEEQKSPKPTVDLSELITGMKIDRTKKPSPNLMGESGRAQEVRRILGRQPPQKYPPAPPRGSRDTHVPQPRMERVDLFGAEPLGIFKEHATGGHQSTFDLDTWSKLQQRELRIAVLHPPKNLFEEMILWTEQGKLWKFPIDNEQGLDEEAKVSFTEHVFLEHHLEPWCPRRGPIRHFMELVCVGLSKNSFLTVEEKRKHIQWYRDYFNNKKDILAEIGALG